MTSLVIVCPIVYVRSSLDHRLGDEVETFICRDDAERIEEVRGDDPELASSLRIDERGARGWGPN